MALKKSDLYSNLWKSCDALRGGMDASQYKDYILAFLFLKYISDKFAGVLFSPVDVPPGSSFTDMVALKGTANIGDDINKKIIAPLVQANSKLVKVFPDFNDEAKLGKGKDMVDRLSNIISIFQDIDFSKNHADGDDMLGDAYEYLMMQFAAESGKSKGQFYTPAEVSRIMAKILDLSSMQVTASTTVYDPTCGSGSLLLKVAAEASVPPTLYGQEFDLATSALARMNMIVHNFPNGDIRQGNTLSNPLFKDGENLKTFDLIVANPPFSDKNWTTGFSPDEDEYGRFDGFGVPPDKQGDYAYLLHMVRSLKSTGRGCIILPHGVLFRGNAEADIRKNLIDKGIIKGIIGLPANLFYGTGIPACIIVMDKSRMGVSKDIFMIDASNGFMKDGPKNRLREQDIHLIVDTFTTQTEITGFSKKVSYAQIVENEFNLNLPRYIDNQSKEDVQDIPGLLRGAIPDMELDGLDKYWSLFPGLREVLFEQAFEGYSQVKVDKAEIKSSINQFPAFQTYSSGLETHFAQWWDTQAVQLRAKSKADVHPKALIKDFSNSILAHYKSKTLIDPYDVFQNVMDYWNDIMQDDAYVISKDGWVGTPETLYEIKKGNNGDVKKKVGWTTALIPKSVIMDVYFSTEKAKLLELQSQLENTTSEIATLLEEQGGGNGGEDGVLSDVGSASDTKKALISAQDYIWSELQNERGVAYNKAKEKQERLKATENEQKDALPLDKVNNNTIKAKLEEEISAELRTQITTYQATETARKEQDKVVKALEQERDTWIAKFRKNSPNDEILNDLKCIEQYQALKDQEKTLKDKIKVAESDIDTKAKAKCEEIKDDESTVKNLVINHKWKVAIKTKIDGELDRINQHLTQRLKTLIERYEHSYPTLKAQCDELESKVESDLARMGFSWV